MKALGERSVFVDCDVLQADGGTRCAAITGGFVALHEALAGLVSAKKLDRVPLTGSVAAVSVGMVEGAALCDLDYSEDSTAEVDANVVMTGDGGLVEVQATAERTPLSRTSLDELLGARRDRDRAPARGPGARDRGAGLQRRRLMAVPRLVVATRNEHKLRELAEILSGYELVPLPRDVELPPEDADSFAGNALIKARAAHDATGEAGDRRRLRDRRRRPRRRPGSRSARFAGDDATDEQNLAQLFPRSRAEDDRSVAYVCALAYVDAGGAESVFEGRCEGTLAREPRGSGGFGYDPAFVPDDTGPGDSRTMAELSRPKSTRSATAGARRERSRAGSAGGRAR